MATIKRLSRTGTKQTGCGGMGRFERLEDRRLLSAIAGAVYSDINGDGSRQEGEPGLGSWQVFIDRSGDGQRQDGEPIVTSNSLGQFSFGDLPPGSYRIAEIVKDGYTQTGPVMGFFDVQLAVNQVQRLAFGNRNNDPLRGAIRGTIFNDADSTGTRGLTEGGLGGWTVYLDTSNDGSRQEGEPTTLTGADGRYAFEGLVAGPYHVREVVQSGWQQTAPQTGVYDVNLLAGQNAGDRNFGDHRIETPPPTTGTIRGVVFNDIDSDGTRDDGEAGLAGWTVYLDTNPNGQRDDGEPTRTTGTDGRYAFEGLPAGQYTVREVVQSGFTQTGPPNGAYVVSLAAGQSIGDQNFGDHRNEPPPPPPTGSIRGVVFNDIDSDGVRDDGEAGLAGWIVYLDTNPNGQRDDGEPTRTTGDGGSYAFEGLIPGQFTVREFVQSGFTQTGPTTGAYVVTVAGGQSAGDRNFGNHRIETPAPASIRGVVFNDIDSDGVRDDGEAGLSGWVVYLDTNPNGQRDDGEPTRTTGTDGRYAFEGLPAGQYTVREVVQSGFTQTGPVNNAYTITLAAGQAANDRNFGDHRNEPPPPPPSGTIRGVVFNDIDSDGVRDEGEAGLSGWVVYLDTNPNGQRDDGEPTRTTGTGGTYAFEGLTPGQYAVREVAQTGFTQTGPPDGFYIVSVAGGQSVGDRNFGNHRNEPPPPPLANVRGVVFNDLDSDGTRDDGEAGLPGWTVFIDADQNGQLGNEERRTISGDGGRYAFEGLAPGSYRIAEVLQAGWAQTAPANGGFYDVTLVAGQNLTDRNFGDHRTETPPPTQTGAIGGRVFNDVNGDGIRQDGEAWLGGFQVYIDANTNGAYDDGEKSTLTNATGNWRFSNLAAGQYVFRLRTELAWLQTTPQNNGGFAVTLSEGQVTDGFLFGIRRPVRLSRWT